MYALQKIIKRIGIIRIYAIIVFAIFFGLCYSIQPPYLFPQDTVITVKSGESFKEIAQDFKNQHIIHSTIVFRAVVSLMGSARNIVAGDYYFETPLSLFELAARLKAGSLNLKSEKVTIPEGSTVSQIADILTDAFPRFDHDSFIALAERLAERVIVKFQNYKGIYGNVTGSSGYSGS